MPGDDGHDDLFNPLPAPQEAAFAVAALPPPPEDVLRAVEDVQGEERPFLQADNSFLLLKATLTGPYSRKIADEPKITAGEALLNAMTMINHYKFNHTQAEAIMRLINSLFQKNILPPSRHCIDKLLKSSAGAHYHFYCSKCFNYLGEKNYEVEKTVECTVCKKQNNISDLNSASFFLNFNLPTQLEILFSDPDILKKLKNPRDLISIDDTMRDLYDGKIYQQFIKSLPADDGVHHISLCLSDDGSALFKTNSVEVWPIFVNVLELSPDVRGHKLLLAGLWFGSKKPIQDLFLKPFIAHTNDLSEIGFEIQVADNQVWRMKAHLIACCCDAPARAAVQCVHQHNGHCGCNWCLHPGTGIGPGQRKYYILDQLPELRTAAELRRDGLEFVNSQGRVDVNGVIGLSRLLLSRTLDPIEGMILDMLHHSDHGIGKQVPGSWLGEHGAKVAYYIGSPFNLEKIEALIEKIRLPIEARRPARKISEFAEYQARDHQNFNLLFSVPLLLELDIPTFKPFLRHWILFVQGMHLLMQRELPQQHVNLAHILLCEFAGSFEQIYGEEGGKEHMSYNVHITFHAAENAARWGPAWALNAYAFEAGNKKLKNAIASGRGIASQVIRAVSQDCALMILEYLCGSPETEKFREDIKKETVVRCITVNGGRYLGTHKSFHPSPGEEWWCNRLGINIEDFIQVEKLVHFSCVYAPFNSKLRTNNSVACLKNKSYVLIEKIIVSEIADEGYLVVRRIHTSAAVSVKDVPSDLIFLKTVDFIEDACFLITPEVLDIVCVRIKFLVGDYVIKMPNISNTC